MKRYILITALVLSFGLLHAQMPKPLTWSVSVTESNDTSFIIQIKANIAKDWYIYSEDVAEGGPMPLIINFDETTTGIKGTVLKSANPPHVYFDEIFGMDVRYYEDTAVFERYFVPSGNKIDMLLSTEAQACFKKDGQCILVNTDMLIQAEKKEEVWVVVDTKIINK